MVKQCLEVTTFQNVLLPLAVFLFYVHFCAIKLSTSLMTIFPKILVVLRVQLKSWAGKALETVNSCAFLKRRLIGPR
jgi:hypothetical protein